MNETNHPARRLRHGERPTEPLVFDDAAANKAAEEGALDWPHAPGRDGAHDAPPHPDRASRQATNKAEVDLSSLFRSDWSELGMLPASEGTYVDFEHLEALLATPPATTGASTVDLRNDEVFDELLGDYGDSFGKLTGDIDPEPIYQYIEQAYAKVGASTVVRPTDDDLWDATLRDRDAYHEWADKLADAISKHFGVDIGEHSNQNLPWAEALEAIENAESVGASTARDQALEEAAVICEAVNNHDNPMTAGDCADSIRALKGPVVAITLPRGECEHCHTQRPLHLTNCPVAIKGMAEGKPKEPPEPLRQLLIDFSNNTYFCGLHLDDDAKYAGFLEKAKAAEQAIIELFQSVGASTVLTDERIKEIANQHIRDNGWSIHSPVDFARAIEREVAAQAGQVAVPDDVARDAARYRWLRNDPPMTLCVRSMSNDGASTYLDDVVLDASVDVAMRASPAKESK